LTFRPSGGSIGIAATPCWPERQDSILWTKCAFCKELKELAAVIRHDRFAQLRGHWALMLSPKTKGKELVPDLSYAA
jgi:hypothetical protein